MSRRTDEDKRKADGSIKKMMANIETATADTIVYAITTKLLFAMWSDGEGHTHRLDAARMLLILRKRIEAEGNDWWKFYRQNFSRSRRDAEKLLATASANDPEQAAEEAAGKNARHQANTA